MDATLTSNLFIVFLVTAVISGLMGEEKKAPDAIVDSRHLNTLITQQIFRQCGNSLESNSICIKLIDDLAQGVITKDEFLNHIKHSDTKKQTAPASASNLL